MGAPLHVGPVGASTSWSDALQGVEFVVHCAGLAHQVEVFADDRRLVELGAQLGQLRARRGEFSLHGAHEIGGMWRMLCRSARKRSRDEWSLKASDLHVEGDRGRAHWEVSYLYGTADRLVLNAVDAEFEFTPDGLILRHVDHFDFRAWAAQALGWPGRLFGGLPPMQRFVRKQAADKLARFLASHL